MRLLLGLCFIASLFAGESKRIGQEVAVPRRLADDKEFEIPISELLAYGSQLFSANWTVQEGGGRPQTKGNGKALSDPSKPLSGPRAFNRLSAPDANSCAGCHNMPYGIVGGGGDFVTSVFVLGQRFDFATLDASDEMPTRGGRDERGRAVTAETFSNFRATTGMFGAGYIEMLASGGASFFLYSGTRGGRAVLDMRVAGVRGSRHSLATEKERLEKYVIPTEEELDSLRLPDKVNVTDEELVPVRYKRVTLTMAMTPGWSCIHWLRFTPENPLFESFSRVESSFPFK